MNASTSSITSTSWIIILVVVLVILFIFLFVIWMFMSSGTASTVVIVLAILFLFLAIGLFAYFWFFSQSSNNSSNSPTGTAVLYGDTVQIKSTSFNQYASPCGTTANNCGLSISLRTDESFNRNNGETARLRKWVVSGGTVGSNVTYQGVIALVSVINNQTMAVCTRAIERVEVDVTDSGVAGSDRWIVLNSTGITGNVNYGDIISLRNSTYETDDLPPALTYLGVCTLPDCKDASDPGNNECGQLIIPTTTQDTWTLEKVT